MTEAITETIGCDLGDKTSELCILLPTGEVQKPGPVRTRREAFTEFFTRPPAHVIIEVGQHSRWVSELLEKLGHKVTVANPRKVKLISEGRWASWLGEGQQSWRRTRSYRNSSTMKRRATENSRMALPGAGPGVFLSCPSPSRATAQIGTALPGSGGRAA